MPCVYAQCVSDDDCSSPTSHCNVGTGICVECLNEIHCYDGNECTEDSCSGYVCSNAQVENGTACTSGTCCSGVCDVAAGNSDFHEDCRTGPVCVGASFEYVAANEGVSCESKGTCQDGICVPPSGCLNDGDCNDPVPYCKNTSGVCVECLQQSHCDDLSPCTEEICAGYECNYTYIAEDGAPCPKGRCCASVCNTEEGDTNLHDECRLGPICVGENWTYVAANEGVRCESEGICKAGSCRIPGEYTSETEEAEQLTSEQASQSTPPEELETNEEGTLWSSSSTYIALGMVGFVVVIGVIYFLMRSRDDEDEDTGSLPLNRRSSVVFED